ncbi:MAG: hypothetical protein KME20_11190 [Kaiparowitsia implicata GSE-PSE-MK54-09C]|jgi:hypothetical protein|nr:hypothetical protein [Kaiparowitsia implicata GSE-PSE-MK54-09C]
MLTQFVTIEVPLEGLRVDRVSAETGLALSPAAANLPAAIYQALKQYGEPLRWAVTAVDTPTRTATVEAVVTYSADCPTRFETHTIKDL